MNQIDLTADMSLTAAKELILLEAGAILSDISYNLLRQETMNGILWKRAQYYNDLFIHDATIMQ